MTDPGLPLDGLTVVEVSSFVAAPLCGMTLNQLGAEVIRVDPIGGASDVQRWPLSADGTSIYWTGLNKESVRPPSICAPKTARNWSSA